MFDCQLDAIDRKCESDAKDEMLQTMKSDQFHLRNHPVQPHRSL
jgi:hypothetical protein